MQVIPKQEYKRLKELNLKRLDWFNFYGQRFSYGLLLEIFKVFKNTGVKSTSISFDTNGNLVLFYETEIGKMATMVVNRLATLETEKEAEARWLKKIRKNK